MARMSGKQLIQIQIFRGTLPRSIKAGDLKKLSKVVLSLEGISSGLISIAFLNDEKMDQVNREFLRHQGTTDVITFSFPEETKIGLQGEILIGWEVAQREALVRGHSIMMEIILYLIHGLLHLCGFDDLKKVERKKMRERERFHLQNLGLPLIGPEH